MAFVVILTPLDEYPTRRYEITPRFCRIFRRSFAELEVGGGALDNTLLLFDNTGLRWDLLRGQQAIFVRPLRMEGEAPAILLMPWLLVPPTTYNEIHTDFYPALRAASARFKLGIAENLIFLAQLTPVR